MFDQYISPTLEVGISGGRRLLDIYLAQTESNQDSKLLKLREVQIMNKEAYAEIVAELFQLFVSNHIIGGFFVTDALRHWVKIMAFLNRSWFDHFTKCEIYIGRETKKVNMKIWGPPHSTSKLNAIFYSICSRPGKK
ncbi:MAG: hypothetical protein EZS28_011169 [Streblomastix strix]|uniref:Uncharacterized protein n=1 Tax=Streblomastix strix TaxID=222440 RepID=A0A5J4WEG6_9EUKA|nr:MAG: hypothetical protein EZS28_011169 [Streblomastix strix]